MMQEYCNDCPFLKLNQKACRKWGKFDIGWLVVICSYRPEVKKGE